MRFVLRQLGYIMYEWRTKIIDDRYTEEMLRQDLEKSGDLLAKAYFITLQIVNSDDDPVVPAGIKGCAFHDHSDGGKCGLSQD